jgi:O-antigen/teichoic acid export membrane protein
MDLDIQLSKLWTMLVVLVAVGIIMNTLLSILEGLQRIKQVAIIRLAQAMFASIALWVSLACRQELHSLFVSLLVSYAGVLAVILLIYRAEIAYGLRNSGTQLSESKRKNDRKYFYKIAVSGVCHYLMFQVFTPILTLKSGPVAAGQFAMSLQIITAINAFGLTWLSSNAPKLGRMVGAKQTMEAKFLFDRILKLSLIMMLLLAVALACGAHYLSSVSQVISARILPPFEFTLLLVSAISNHIVFSWSAYLRAHLDDPFWILAIVNAVCTSFGAWVLITLYGLEGATADYFISANIIGLIGGLYVFKRAGIARAMA